MRRFRIILAVLLVMGAGSTFFMSLPAQSLPAPFWETVTVDHYGKVFHVSSPFEVKLNWVHGSGGVEIYQDIEENGYTPDVFRHLGSVVLTGRPNGFGGYQTSVYTIRTDERDTIAGISYKRK